MEISVQFLILIPIVLGVVQAIKYTGLNSKWYAIISIILGVAGTMSLGGISVDTTLQGIVVGLSAAGLWSGTKSIVT